MTRTLAETKYKAKIKSQWNAVYNAWVISISFPDAVGGCNSESLEAGRKSSLLPPRLGKIGNKKHKKKKRVDGRQYAFTVYPVVPIQGAGSMSKKFESRNPEWQRDLAQYDTRMYVSVI